MKNYYDSITAPEKDFRYVEGGHGSTMLHSEELAQFVHENSWKAENSGRNKGNAPECFETLRGMISVYEDLYRSSAAASCLFSASSRRI